MRSRTFKKSSTRAIKSTITRFISIILISFLGASVFAGLAAVAPNMERAGNSYYDEQNVMDIRMLSTYGFDDEDIQAIRNTDGVSGLMASYTVDAAASIDEADYTLRINGLSATNDGADADYINQLKLIDGQWPQSNAEAIIIRPSIGLKNIVLGSEVQLDAMSNKQLEDTLDRTSFTIVGIAETPYYLSFMQGNSSVGSGGIDYVLYIPLNNFFVDGYTDVYLTLYGAKEQEAFSNEYFQVTDVAIEILELLAEERQSLRHDAFQSDLAEAQQEYADADKEADEKFADARAELTDAEKELEDAKKQYADGLVEYQEQKADAEQQLAEARAELADAERELEEARQRYADGLAEYNEQKAVAEQQLADARVELDDAERELEDAKEKYADGLAEYNEQKADAEQQLAEARAELDDAASQIASGENELAAKKRELADAEASLQAARGELNSGWDEYNSKVAELAVGKAVLAESKAQLDAAQAEYDENAAAAEAATGMTMEEIESELPAMRSQLNEARVQYEALSLLERLKLDRDAAVQGSMQYRILNLIYQAALRAADLTEPEAEALFSELDEMQAKIQDAQAQYEQLAELVAAKQTLAEKWAQYDAAAAQIADGEAQLPGAKQELESGEAEYSAKSAKLESARMQIAAAENKLASAKREYREGLAEYNAKKAEAEEKLADAKAELDEAAAKISEGENELAEAWQEYYEKKAEADTKLADAKAELDDAAVKILDGENEYADGWQEYNDKKSEADTKLADARTELADAAAQIADGERELADGWQEYEDKKLEASTELAEAKQKIADVEERLSELGEPKWYVLDRNMNEAFVTYDADIQRMYSLATVFPVLFYLVAALVCLTTMTRMVEEDRTLIGTFKALGYSNKKITGRYMKYAVSASLIGSVFGVIFGLQLLPSIVWNAYSIVYALPEMKPAFYWGIGILSSAATVLVIAFATGIAAKNTLQETPANLMRPKAPKSGKRVFLEYVTPVWKRLSFSQTVTVRNLGLNKKRLLMSLVGIIGCTSLIVSAFGARSAVSAITVDQFGRIFNYDVKIGFNQEEPSDVLISVLEDKAYFGGHTLISYKAAEAGMDGISETYNIYLVSPQDAKEITDFITLSDPDTGEPFAMTEESVIITEKLAMNFNIGVGDTIWVSYLDETEKHSVTVTAITTNYTFNFVHLGAKAYNTSFGKNPSYNEFMAVTAEGISNEAIKALVTGIYSAGSVSFTDELMGDINTSIKSVNAIIWILIVVAGLLAFVVLYNLTNINIGERQRELATLKVLGFYDNETYRYIFREINITSFIGGLVGLLAGTFVYRMVVTTVEPDMILLSRQVTGMGYASAFILTMLFTLMVNQFMKQQIKRIDMLESLKSVD